MKHLLAILAGSLLMTSAFAEIIETQEIETVLDYVSQDSIVFFNITGTLYEPSNALSDNQWREYFANRVKEIAPDQAVGHALVNRTKNLIVQKIPKKNVEQKTPQLIADLQNKKIPVLGLTKKQASTSYADNFAWITQNHLASLGIHLDKTLGYLRFTAEPPMTLGYTFVYGILFTNKQSEGKAVQAFVNTIEKKPSIVIAVDNTLSSLEDIEQILNANKIKFVGLRYGRADKTKANFDATLGIIEFLTYVNEGRILSDAEALKIKQTQKDVNQEALLDEYIRTHLGS